MNKILKKLFLICFLFSNFAFAENVILYDVIPVNVTSDSAVKAKKIAIDSAKRKAIINILSNYSNTSELYKALDESKNIEDLISSISIDTEKQSSKTYSANIKIVLNEKESKLWMDKNLVQNWLNLDNQNTQDKIQVIVNLKNAIHDWIDFNKQLYFSGITFDIESIQGSIISGNISKSKKQSFLSIIRNSGWNLNDSYDSVIVKKL